MMRPVSEMREHELRRLIQGVMLQTMLDVLERSQNYPVIETLREATKKELAYLKVMREALK